MTSLDVHFDHGVIYEYPPPLMLRVLCDCRGDNAAPFESLSPYHPERSFMIVECAGKEWRHAYRLGYDYWFVYTGVCTRCKREFSFQSLKHFSYFQEP